MSRRFPFGSYELCRDVATRLPSAKLVVISDRSIIGEVAAGDETDRYVATIDGFLRLARRIQ